MGLRRPRATTAIRAPTESGRKSPDKADQERRPGDLFHGGAALIVRLGRDPDVHQVSALWARRDRQRTRVTAGLLLVAARGLIDPEVLDVLVADQMVAKLVRQREPASSQRPRGVDDRKHSSFRC